MNYIARQTLATLRLNIMAHDILASTTRIETTSSEIHNRLTIRRVSNMPNNPTPFPQAITIQVADIDRSFYTATVVDDIPPRVLLPAGQVRDMFLQTQVVA